MWKKLDLEAKNMEVGRIHDLKNQKPWRDEIANLCYKPT